MAKKTTNLDLDEIMKDDYGLPMDSAADSDLTKELEMILKEEGSGFGKQDGKSFSSSLKFDPKLSYPKYDKETQDLLDQSDKLFSNTSTNQDKNEFLKKLMAEEPNEPKHVKVEHCNEAHTLGIDLSKADPIDYVDFKELEYQKKVYEDVFPLKNHRKHNPIIKISVLESEKKKTLENRLFSNSASSMITSIAVLPLFNKGPR